jgi:TolA-binding protein
VFDDEEARARIEALKGEHAELVKRVERINRNQVDFANQIEAVKADIAKLRGQIEVLGYELEATQKRQKDFYVDLDNRVRKLETAPPPEAKPETPKLDTAQETRDYEAALASLKALKYKEAGAAFLAFIKAYPNGTLAASAHYWGGYAHAQATGSRHCRRPVRQVCRRLAGRRARTRARWKAGFASLEALKDAKAARATLELLADKYPATDAGKRAKLRLKRK